MWFLGFDACKSIVRRGNSGHYNLKPVIAVIPRIIDVGTIEGFVDPSIAAATIVSAQSGAQWSKPLRRTQRPDIRALSGAGRQLHGCADQPGARDRSNRQRAGGHCGAHRDRCGASGAVAAAACCLGAALDHRYGDHHAAGFGLSARAADHRVDASGHHGGGRVRGGRRSHRCVRHDVARRRPGVGIVYTERDAVRLRTDNAAAGLYSLQAESGEVTKSQTIDVKPATSAAGDVRVP